MAAQILGNQRYLFGLKEARMWVYGFKEGEDEAFLTAATFSLETRGILKQPSAAMLVVNGEKDTQVPIADLYPAAHRFPEIRLGQS